MIEIQDLGSDIGQFEISLFIFGALTCYRTGFCETTLQD